MYRYHFLSISIAALLLASCASAPSNPTGTTAQTPSPKPAPVQTPSISPPTTIYNTPAPAADRQYGSFYDWKQQFIARAATTHNAHQVQSLLGSASLNEQVIRLDGNQAEFAKMPWEYLDSAVSSSRVNLGIQKRREMLDVLTRAENRYGVPASIVTAIWGIESSYGAVMGNTDLVNALSSLAYEGRRRTWAESQLLSMLTLINRGDIQPYQLKGSWAGGMGHTQFIPSTWLNEGVDGDNDGRRNPFSAADALSSTASYLANSGWVANLPAYYEVRLPSSFNYQLIGTTHTLDAWQAIGITGVGQPITGNHLATLWLPAGINGPALLTTKNFDVIKVYNNSSNYALAVALLANRINQRSGLVTSFPRHEQPLSSHQVQRLQNTLTQQGYDTKGIDGVIGSNTRNAFARWQADNGQIPDGFISQSSARSLLW